VHRPRAEDWAASSQSASRSVRGDRLVGRMPSHQLHPTTENPGHPLRSRTAKSQGALRRVASINAPALEQTAVVVPTFVLGHPSVVSGIKGLPWGLLGFHFLNVVGRSLGKTELNHGMHRKPRPARTVWLICG